MGSERKKQDEVTEPHSDSSGKLDIEVPLDYETEDSDLLEEQEKLEKLGLQNDYSTNITFDEMMLVVNEVGNDQSKAHPKTGKLLYENENTDWIEKLASSSEDNSKRITALIDLHMNKLAKNKPEIKSDDEGLKEFDISEYLNSKLTQ